MRTRKEFEERLPTKKNTRCQPRMSAHERYAMSLTCRIDDFCMTARRMAIVTQMRPSCERTDVVKLLSSPNVEATKTDAWTRRMITPVRRSAVRYERNSNFEKNVSISDDLNERETPLGPSTATSVGICRRTSSTVVTRLFMPQGKVTVKSSTLMGSSRNSI